MAAKLDARQIRWRNGTTSAPLYGVKLTFRPLLSTRGPVEPGRADGERQGFAEQQTDAGDGINAYIGNLGGTDQR